MRKEYDKEYSKKYRIEHPDWKKESNKKWKEKHPNYWKNYYNNYWKNYFPRYYQNNKEKIILKIQEWRKNNKERVRKYLREYKKDRKKTDNKFRLDINMGIAICQALKGKKAGRKWEDLVDYTLDDLMSHLEKQFDGLMNWDNYGSFWWIDHRKPISLFKYEAPEDLEFKKCWSLENLQPMEKIANIKKGNKF